MDAPPVLVIALGGNALVRKGQRGSIAEQFANLRAPLAQVARLAAKRRIVLTHGNGPQVGRLMQGQDACAPDDPLPLEILVAQTQGQLGYMIESTLDEAFNDAPGPQPYLVSLISYVLVDADDPAFATPTKPVGPVLTKAQAEAAPYPVAMTAKGLRRVVASPEPRTIVERHEIAKLVDEGFLVVCCGGGGIPVVRQGRGFDGVDAVIDKDLASAVLGAEIGAKELVIATDVPGVALDYGTARERWPRRLTAAQAEADLLDGQFPAGSMGPKVRACLDFLEHGGSSAVICHLDDIEAAVRGRAGTTITG